MPKTAVILAAAGRSSRFRDPFHKKPFALLDQKPVWLYSTEKFLARSDVVQVIVVVSAEDKEDFFSRFGANVAVLGLDVTTGGEERHHSVAKGLERLQADVDFVAIHDAARPCLAEEMIEQCFSTAYQSGAAVPAIPVTSTLKSSSDGTRINATVDRSSLYLAQTPQVFRRDWLEQSYARLNGAQPTDEAQALELAGFPVSLVPGSPFNIKITHRADLKLASCCLKALPAPKLDARPHPFGDDAMWR